MTAISRFVFLCLWCATALGGQTPVTIPLAKGEEAKSPTKDAICFAEYDENKPRNAVVIRFHGGNQRTIWKAVRSVGVGWSPGGEYLVIEDYLDRVSTVVLVFKVDYQNDTANLIYQSPYSNSVFAKYYAVDWLKGGSTLVIRYETSDNKGDLKVSLVEQKSISQTVYCDCTETRGSSDPR